jgi:serine O-acetyltransferase
VRVEGRRPEGPDADWIHLPDPIADALAGLASRIGALERAVAELSGHSTPQASDPQPDAAPPAQVRPLHSAKFRNPAGG